MDVSSWLRDLGLGRYEPTFIENAIDSDVLPELTEGDLEKLGIPLGDRKRLIKAIRTMLADSSSASITSGAGEDVQSGQPGVGAAERRHLTVMICDLVGSTALSTRLDPEDMGAVMDAYHAACARIVQGYDGFVGDFRGDGILAYFGYPRAHEDDAERTVRAALEIIAAVAELETHAAEPLAVSAPGESASIALIALMRRFLSPSGIPSFSRSSSVNSASTSPSIAFSAKRWAYLSRPIDASHSAMPLMALPENAPPRDCRRSPLPASRPNRPLTLVGHGDLPQTGIRSRRSAPRHSWASPGPATERIPQRGCGR